MEAEHRVGLSSGVISSWEATMVADPEATATEATPTAMQEEVHSHPQMVPGNTTSWPRSSVRHWAHPRKRLNPWVGPLELKQFGGLEMWDLPKLHKYCKDGKNHACNCGLLGICPRDDNTCKFVRVDHRDLSPDFVKAYTDMAGPALEKVRDALRDGKKVAKPANNGYRSRGGGGGTRMF